MADLLKTSLNDLKGLCFRPLYSIIVGHRTMTVESCLIRNNEKTYNDTDTLRHYCNFQVPYCAEL